MVESKHFLFKCRHRNRQTTPKQEIKTYIYNEKVQPTPGVGEVGLEAICNPFKEHLDDEDIGENFVCKLQNNFDGSPSFYVYVFKGLQKDEITVTPSENGFRICCTGDNTHQSSTAEENHKDDEGFKPVMLHNSEASSTQVPPFLAFALGDVDSETWPAPHTV